MMGLQPSYDVRIIKACHILAKMLKAEFTRSVKELHYIVANMNYQILIVQLIVRSLTCEVLPTMLNCFENTWVLPLRH